MKKYIIITIGLFLTLITVNSCKEDIDLIGEYKETAVIYGLLDQSESTHYIKIHRAFIGPGNALDIAKIPDSSYFVNVDATITETVDNHVTRTWILQDTTINNKSENGVFYAPTEKLYYFTDASQGALNIEATYKLEVIINKGLSNEFIVTGETKLVSGITSDLSKQSKNFKFVDTNTGELSASEISCSNTGNAYVINSSMIIDFYEFNGTTLLDSVSIDWNAGETEVQPGSTSKMSLQGKTFYELIRDHCTANSAINKRQIKSLTIKITGGSDELNNYINSNKPSSSLAQTKPNFTNLSVTNDRNVVGIFSARSTLKIVKPFSIPLQNFRAIDSKSTEELCIGTITGNYFFCSNHPSDNLSTISYYCP